MGIESINNANAAVAAIRQRIDQVTANTQARFSEILNSVMVDTQSLSMSTPTEQTSTENAYLSDLFLEDSSTLTSAELLMLGNEYTGRYCIHCGEAETTHNYSDISGLYNTNQLLYTGQVDTSDGMLEKAAPYMDIIEEASVKYGIPVNVIMGVIKAESDYNPQTVSYAGAAGLMQIMPVNAEEFGMTDIFDPWQNIMCGTDEIARHLETYDGDLKLALAAYNTGPGNVAKRNITSSNSSEYLTLPQSIRDYVDRVYRYSGLA